MFSLLRARLFRILFVGFLLSACAWFLRPFSTTASSLSQQAPASSSSRNSTSIDPRVSFAEGQSALQSGDLDAAEAAFRRVLSVDPQSGSAYANLGVIAMRRKEWDHALALLQKAEKLEPKMSGIRLNIGLVKYRRGDYAGAIPPLASVVREEPDSLQARYLLGLCRVFTERYADAVATLEPLWPQMSTDINYLYVLDIAAHNAGNNALDDKALSRLVEVGSQTPEFHLI
ncbi:MAG: tetratricopeptide repeat protein, partial [Candidatus Acidiferrum sp.]